MGILSGITARALQIAASLLLLSATIYPRVDRAWAQVAPSQSAIAVIVSAESKVYDLPKAVIKRVFLGEPTEVDGVRLLPFNHAPEDPLRRQFDRLLLGFEGDATGRYWIDRRIRGQGLPPRVIPNVAIVRAAVAKLTQAISYLRIEQLDASVRALRIDGIPYTASEYPLK
jgi:hypothetical protein